MISERVTGQYCNRTNKSKLSPNAAAVMHPSSSQSMQMGPLLHIKTYELPLVLSQWGLHVCRGLPSKISSQSQDHGSNMWDRCPSSPPPPIFVCRLMPGFSSSDYRLFHVSIPKVILVPWGRTLEFITELTGVTQGEIHPLYLTEAQVKTKRETTVQYILKLAILCHFRLPSRSSILTSSTPESASSLQNSKSTSLSDILINCLSIFPPFWVRLLSVYQFDSTPGSLLFWIGEKLYPQKEFPIRSILSNNFID